MIPSTIVRKGLESLTKVARPARKIGSSRTSKNITSRPSQVRFVFAPLFSTSGT